MMSRDPNTDFMRASAIGLVLIHHIAQFLPLLPEIGHQFLRLGAYGVDLFFVLSGWLVGRLYWVEQKSFGNVDVLRFWGRRWFRTIPPYFAVLPLAFLAVHLSRGEPFEWRYLFFLQNYDKQVPFYLVSWSLCVEEHFYLFLPVVLLFVARLRVPTKVALPILIPVSAIGRFLDVSASPEQPFGYTTTATHLRLEGLVIGVWFAYLSVVHVREWTTVQKLSRLLLIPLSIGFLTLPFWSTWYAYYFGSSYVAILWGALLASLTALPPIRLARFRATYLLALWSYSIYLTHSLVLNICVAISDKLGVTKEFVFPLWLALIVAIGALTYAAVERPAFLVRDRMVPRRKLRDQGPISTDYQDTLGDVPAAASHAQERR